MDHVRVEENLLLASLMLSILNISPFPPPPFALSLCHAIPLLSQLSELSFYFQVQRCYIPGGRSLISLNNLCIIFSNDFTSHDNMFESPVFCSGGNNDINHSLEQYKDDDSEVLSKTGSLKRATAGGVGATGGLLLRFGCGCGCGCGFSSPLESLED